MNQSKKIFTIILLISMLLFPAACTQQETPTATQPLSSFDQFLDQVFVDNMKKDSFSIHYMMRYPEKYQLDKTVPQLYRANLNVDSLKKERAEDEKLLQQLKTFNFSCLSKEQQTNYLILKDYTERLLAVSQQEYFYMDYHFLSPTLGFQAQLPLLLSEYRFDNKQDIANYLSLLEQSEESLQTYFEYAKLQAAHGTIYPDRLLNGIVQQCSTFAGNQKNHFLITGFNQKLSSITGLTNQEIKHYKAQNKLLVTQTLLPAYAKLGKNIATLKGSRKGIGCLKELPKGKDYYQDLFSLYTGMDDSIPQAKSYLKQKIQTLLSSLQQQYQNNSPNNEINYPEIMNQQATTILSFLKNKTLNSFPALKNTQFQVKFVDPSMQNNLSPALYLTSPFDDLNSKETIYLNVTNDSSAFYIYSVLAHEGYPGHLYQNSYFKSKQYHPIRYLISYSGYTEGWATYAEHQSVSFTKANPFVIQEQLATDLNYAVLAVADIGIHYEGWDFKLFKKHLGKYFNIQRIKEKELQNMYDTIIEAPANILVYYYPYFKLDDLKNKALKQMQNQFDLKTFNQIILDTGPAPFALIESNVQKYIDTVQ